MLHVNLESNQLVIQNLSKLYTKYHIEAISTSYQHMYNGDLEIDLDEIIYVPLVTNNNFFNKDINNNIQVRVYANSKLVYEKIIYKDHDRAWILMSNQKFEPLIKALLYGLTKYSKYPIIHYCIDYKPSFKFDNVENRYMEGENSNHGQFMQFAKSRVFLNALESGIKHAIFLDADIQVKPNIDNLFNIEQVTKGPIFQKSFWDYTLVGGTYVPAEGVRNYLGVDEHFQKAPNGITNMVIFNQSQLELFKEWENVCFSQEIAEIMKTEFLHDELLLNCLCWKNGWDTNLVYVGLNVISEKDVKFFYQTPNLKGNPYTNYNEYDLGQLYQSYEPYNKDDITFFHCIKDIDTANKINLLIEQEELIKDNSEEFFKQKLIDFYTNIPENKERIMKTKAEFVPTFINGAKLEIKRGGIYNYDVVFLDKDTNEIIHQATIGNNMWVKTSKVYFKNYKIIVRRDGELVYEHDINFKNKRVFITMDSSALGDNLAWVPYAEEFRKKHNCHVVCSTFHNDLFKGIYSDIEFVNPGSIVPHIYAQYVLCWPYAHDTEDIPNLNRTPNEFRHQPMQKVAADILGLEFKEVRPKIKMDKGVKKEKQVTIAIHGTFQAKYWNNPTGWQEVVDYLKSKGYKVLLLSYEGSNYMGNIHPTGIEQLPKGPLKKVIRELQKSEVFIGIGSGLSWLAWATETPTILISGFSEEYTEPQEGIIRIGAPEGKCRGCFNSHRFDPGDWHWCPMHKGTEKQYECTKTITGEKIIKNLKKLLKS